MEPRVFRAFLRGIRISPRKVRLIANMVRGMGCNEAVSALEYTPQRGGHFLGKLLKSAIANVNNYNDEHNSEFDVDNMFISELRVDDGPRLKRWRAAPMGRAVPILRRTCHISLSLQERPVVGAEDTVDKAGDKE